MVKSPEATSNLKRWTPPTGVQCHPPKFEATDSKPEQCTPVWVPDPEAADERDVRPRTLVLCFDGTGDQFDDDVSVLESTPSSDTTHVENGYLTYRTLMSSNSLLASRKMTGRDNSSTTKPVLAQLRRPTSSLQ